MYRIKVFISSAIQELEYEREIATRVVEDLNLHPAVFEGLPAMSKDLEDSYLDEVRSCDIFVLILWKTLRPAVLLEYQEAVRANKPILIFVKLTRADERRERELVAFLGKIERMSEARALDICLRFYKHYRSLKELEAELKRGIVGEIERKLSESVTITDTQQELYELATGIVKFARRRLCVMQRTPSFFCERPSGYKEEQFLSCLTNWIEEARQDSSREFIYLYRADRTGEEIRMQGKDPTLIAHVKAVIQKYKEIEHASKRRICFSSLPSNYQGPMFGAGDDRFAMWLGDGDRAISYVNAKMAEGFVKLFHQLGDRMTTVDDLFRELDI